MKYWSTYLLGNLYYQERSVMHSSKFRFLLKLTQPNNINVIYGSIPAYRSSCGGCTIFFRPFFSRCDLTSNKRPVLVLRSSLTVLYLSRSSFITLGRDYKTLSYYIDHKISRSHMGIVQSLFPPLPHILNWHKRKIYFLFMAAELFSDLDLLGDSKFDGVGTWGGCHSVPMVGIWKKRYYYPNGGSG